MRLFMEKLAVYYPRPYLSIVFEAITVAVYLTAAFCVTLELEKLPVIRKQKGSAVMPILFSVMGN